MKPTTSTSPAELDPDDPGISGDDKFGRSPRQQDAAFREAMLRAGKRLTDPRALLDMQMDEKGRGR